jgi:hypothetical protein
MRQTDDKGQDGFPVYVSQQFEQKCAEVDPLLLPSSA